MRTPSRTAPAVPRTILGYLRCTVRDILLSYPFVGLCIQSCLFPCSYICIGTFQTPTLYPEMFLASADFHVPRSCRRRRPTAVVYVRTNIQQQSGSYVASSHHNTNLHVAVSYRIASDNAHRAIRTKE